MKVQIISLVGGLALASAISCCPQAMAAPSDLGLVGVRSIHGRYLQAHTDGELHASNPHRHEEETWHLVEVDKQRHVYALLNWRNHSFMHKNSRECAPATGSSIGASEQWFMVSGKPYGIPNGVAFKSVVDGTFLGTNRPGQDDRACGGEVSARSPENPPSNNGGWPGWWFLEPAGKPTSGPDFWSTTGKVFEGIFTVVNPVDVVAILELLAL